MLIVAMRIDGGNNIAIITEFPRNVVRYLPAICFPGILLFHFEVYNEVSQNEDFKDTKSNANFVDMHVVIIIICFTNDQSNRV